ncbi:SLC13 family permease [uncultured Clostridium sp.]|uniref:SLC13 family permease n=1 Tax=uncultured Clostridium sp. TaxID=59620 RepID=UPI0025D3D0F7|nr:SLC13 family permease [uncultured Clostridium sp.]
MNKSIKEKDSFKISFIILAVIVVLTGLVTTPPEGLSVEGWRMLAIVVAAMALFISEATPLPITCMMIIFTMKYTGVVPWKTIQQTACSSTVFFCMAGFGLGAALQNTNLAAVLLRTLYKLGRGDSGKMIGAVVWMAAIISIFVSDGAAQIVTLAVVTGVVRAIGDPEPRTSRFAGGMMMAVTVGAFTGGLFLPCSNSVNVAIMDLSEVVSGRVMTFFQWAIFGIPCGFLLTLMASRLIPRYFKPETLTVGQTEEIEKMFGSIPERLDRKDWSYVIITAIMMVCWIASNWIKTLDVATVAIGGMFLMMLPGINLLSGKDYKKNFSAMVIVTMLCIFPLAAGMSSTGAGEWLVNKMFADSTGWNTITVYIMATLAAFMVHTLVPQGSANGALSAAVIAPVCVAAGIPCAAAMFVIGIQAGTGFLFPIEGTWAYTFGTGHYSFGDCIRGNWPLTLAGMLMCVILVPLLAYVYTAIGFIG